MYGKTLKYSFGLPNKTWKDHLLSHFLVPSAEQNLCITLLRVAQAAILHFGMHLNHRTRLKIELLVDAARRKLNVEEFAGTKSTCLLCISPNISRICNLSVTTPLSWTLTRDLNDGLCIKFSLSCLGWHRSQPYSLCGQTFKSLSHFFDCRQAPLMVCTSRAKCVGMLAQLNIPLSPLQVLNCPSAISAYLSHPLQFLTDIAEHLASVYNTSIRAMHKDSDPISQAIN